MLAKYVGLHSALTISYEYTTPPKDKIYGYSFGPKKRLQNANNICDALTLNRMYHVSGINQENRNLNP